MNDSALIIADFIPAYLKAYQSIDSQSLDLKELFRKSKKSKTAQYFFLHVDDPKAFMKKIKQSIKWIGAAGGLVKNGEGKYLFIYRLEKWDLPKGKIDPGEKSKKTALREVEEECGIKVDFLGPKIISTYHIYEMKGELVIKKTNWYEMGVNGKPRLVPQTSEDITDAKWIGKERLDLILEDTYPLIKDVLENSGLYVLTN